MKRIIFNEIKLKSWSGILTFLSLILCCIGMFGSFELLDYDLNRTSNLLSAMGILTISFVHSKMFWYKNYAEWNKKGMNLKLNEFWGKQIIFDFVSRVDFDDETCILKIIDNRGFEKTFNTTDIHKEDIDKLVFILNKNVGLKVV